MSIKKVCELAKLEYTQIYNSLQNKSRRRQLRAGEYIVLCKTLKLDPFGAQKNC